MDIESIADDGDFPFPYPMHVRNPRGLLVRDLFSAISANFQQYVAKEEYLGWTKERRKTADRAYAGRRAFMGIISEPWTVHGELEESETWLRRVDYMGDRVLFRGLEPSPVQDRTWILFLGPE
jgi:hypothetical protein